MKLYLVTELETLTCGGWKKQGMVGFTKQRADARNNEYVSPNGGWCRDKKN
jgi:hypothetical protein